MWADPVTKQCKPCVPNCKTCIGPHTNDCSTCHKPDFLKESPHGECGECDEGTYGHSSTNICVPCDNCLLCSEKCQADNSACAQTCKKCDETLVLETGVSNGVDIKHCPPECHEGKYPNADKECVPCTTPCDTCSTAVKCKTCLEVYYILGETCYPDCPEGYTEDAATRTCVPCHGTCKSCDGIEEDECV